MGPNKKTMFLFPDGSGSATSYMHLPRVDEGVAVVAMKCPHMTTPRDMKDSFEDITKILLAESPSPAQRALLDWRLVRTRCVRPLRRAPLD